MAHTEVGHRPTGSCLGVPLAQCGKPKRTPSDGHWATHGPEGGGGYWAFRRIPIREESLRSGLLLWSVTSGYRFTLDRWSSPLCFVSPSSWPGLQGPCAGWIYHYCWSRTGLDTQLRCSRQQFRCSKAQSARVSGSMEERARCFVMMLWCG